MTVELTKGAIAALLSGQLPEQPILQCLGTKSISGLVGPRTTIILSDGVYSFATCMLASQLNKMVTDGDLKQHTVFCLKQYQSDVLQGSIRIVICLDIEILQTAEGAGREIGKPLAAQQGSSTGGKLTQGAIMSFINGQKPYQPVLQCLDTSLINAYGTPRIRMIISDGVHKFKTFLLEPRLNNMVEDGRFGKFTVFRLMEYQITDTDTPRFVNCVDIEILQTAEESGGKIGEPVDLQTVQQGPRTMKLSQGAIVAFLNGKHAYQPFLQCIGASFFTENGALRIGITISDGVHLFKTCLLEPHLNNLVLDGHLKKFTVFRLKLYWTSVFRGHKLVHCADIEILQTAEEAGGKIGEPVYLGFARRGRKPVNRSG